MKGRHNTAQVAVQCYSGHTYAQEPQEFTWQGRRHEVVEVERRWRSPSGPVFRLRTTDGVRWQLGYDQASDTWSLQELT